LADALASYRSRRALRHLENAGEFNLRWTVQEGVIKPREMTRRLPEGRWNPTKIPRIQNFMSETRSLLSVGGVASPQLDD
jgi:hypothetical protein